MKRSLLKAVTALAAMATAFVAAPASAGWHHYYLFWDTFTQSWQPIGEAVYDNCGNLIYSTGFTESPYYSSTWVNVPC